MGNTFDRVYKQASCINVAFHGREGGEKGMMMMEGGKDLSWNILDVEEFVNSELKSDLLKGLIEVGDVM